MPIIEIFVLIQVGSAIGALATIAIVIFTAILGTWMLRSQGLSTLNRARNRLAGGEIPAFQLLEGVALAVGGALLLTLSGSRLRAWQLAAAPVRVRVRGNLSAGVRLAIPPDGRQPVVKAM